MKNLQLYLLFVLLVILSVAIHEAAHWIAAILLGYQAYVSFSVTFVNSGGWHLVVISLAGPSMSLSLGIFGVLQVLHSTNLVNQRIGYFLAFISAFGLLLSDFLSTIGVFVTDQQILAYSLGIPESTVRSPFVLISIIILILISSDKRTRYSRPKSIAIFSVLFVIGNLLTMLLELVFTLLRNWNSFLAYPIFYGYPLFVLGINLTISLIVYILYKKEISFTQNQVQLFRNEMIIDN